MIDLFPSREEIYANVTLDHGYNIDPAEIRTHYYRLNQEWENKDLTLERIDTSPQKREDFWSSYNEELLVRSGVTRSDAWMIGNKIFQNIYSDPGLWRLYTDVPEFLRIVQRKKKHLGIIENWDKRLKKILTFLGIKKYFKTITLGGEIGIRKPDVQIFQQALGKTGTKPKNSIYIGDNYVEDAIGAQRAGMTPLLFNAKRRHTDKPILKFHTYQELIDAILET